MPPLSVPEFVERWKASTLSERAAAQSHFIDLCNVLGQPHPAAADQHGDTFTFEKHVSTMDDGKGFADVWKRGFFGWEYKGKHKNLNEAFTQLVRYQGDLENPPLLVTCDQDRFEVHTNFTGTRPLVYSFTLDDLLTATPTANCALPPLDVLRAVFTNPELLRPEAAQVRVTEHVAEEFAKLADSLEQRGVNPESAAHFLMRLLFCLFADSIDLLPDHLFRRMIELDKTKPANFTRKLRQLFGAMATSGSSFGAHDIHYFNGGLFADDAAFELTTNDMAVLKRAAALDWSQVEPAIFGTLFERGLDPGKRSQLGAHYTSREDILLIVEPVVIEPLQRRWAGVKAEALALAKAAEKEALVEANSGKKGTTYPKLRKQLQEILLNWVEELSKVRVLDPACGSGNFLYLALRRMLDLWHEVRIFLAEHALPTFLEKQVHPSQLYGLETNIYAQELASVVVWIGYLQWLNQNGIGWPTEPILRRLDNILHRDAILARDADNKPVEPEWPKADFIIGNPPFLGGKRLRTELGSEYVDALFAVYGDRVPRQADLVTYWFEKARALVESGEAKRVGLLGTQSIRAGASLIVLQKIASTGGIFMAWSDRPWILEGAAVRVSMVAFDDGSEHSLYLDGSPTDHINPDLSSGADLTTAIALSENSSLAFQGVTPIGPFKISSDLGKSFLRAPLNPNGLPNSNVVRPCLDADDIASRGGNGYIIDFGTDMAESDAALYELPFEYVKTVVKPVREKALSGVGIPWWIHQRPRPEMRKALTGLNRYIASPRVSKYRLFVWVEPNTLADSRVVVIARKDDYFLGVLCSKIHELWSLNTCTWHGVGNDPTYVIEKCFEAFPFPWPPRNEPDYSELVEAIAMASRQLMEKRDAWLNPLGSSEEELASRTLTHLYNVYPTWLQEAHRKLDEAVFAGYGWPITLTDAEILGRLLILNHERAA